ESGLRAAHAAHAAHGTQVQRWACVFSVFSVFSVFAMSSDSGEGSASDDIRRIATLARVEFRADTADCGGAARHLLCLGHRPGGIAVLWPRGTRRGEVSTLLLRGYRRAGAGALLATRHPRHALPADRSHDSARLLLGHRPTAPAAWHP